MSEEQQRSPSELRCSPHTTYFTNFFVLKTAVFINGKPAEFGFSDNGLTLNCHYPGIECTNITFNTNKVEDTLKKYGVSHVGNFWLGEVLYLQVGFFSEQSLEKFLRSQQGMQKDMGLSLSSWLRDMVVLTASASPASPGFPVEVETELLLVLPDAEDKMRVVSLENYSSCLALWKESGKFDFGNLFKLKAGEDTTIGLSLRVLVSELNDVTEWFTFGLFLGVDSPELLRIKLDNQSTMECLSHMLQWWVDNMEQPTWSTVVRALEGIRMKGLARNIAVKYAVEMPMNTATDPHPVNITAAGSQTVPAQLPSNIREVYSSFDDEKLTRLNESLPAAKKRLMDARKKHTQVKKKLTITQDRKRNHYIERDTAWKQLEGKEVELGSLKLMEMELELKLLHEQTVVINSDYLKTIIGNKEEEIALLNKKLTKVEDELIQARIDAQQLREQLHQTTVDLAKKSTQVREMKRARAEMKRERSQADQKVMQLWATSQGEQSPLKTVTPAELDALQQSVKEKEEEVARLSSLLEVKETEMQSSRLLEHVERQSQQKEDQLSQLTEEVCELKISLVDAEDRRMKAEVELEDLKSKESVINELQLNCEAVGGGLRCAQTNQMAQFQVNLTYASGEPCVKRQEVSAELISLVNESITQAEVSHQSVGSYEVSYQPSIRGRHDLNVLVNDVAVTGSPFRVYVQQPPQLLDKPVKVIRDLNWPKRVTLSSSEQLVIAEKGCISIFNDQCTLIDRTELQYSGEKLSPSAVAIDDSDTMYVCDQKANMLFKVSSSGKVIKSVGGKGSDNGRLDFPNGIALRDNKLYLCDRFNDRIQIFDCDLNFIRSFGSHGSGEGEFRNPADIAFDQEGNMYIAEVDNGRVQVLSPSNTFIRMISKPGKGPGELSRPINIHVDHNIIYVAEYDNNRISTFTTSGKFVTSFGREGSEEGEFDKPFGITMNLDGYLFICDICNNRIQVF